MKAKGTSSEKRVQTIGFAYKKLVESIWSEAMYEIPGLTLPDTEKILNNQNPVESISDNKKNVVVNLKHAWSTIFNSLDKNLNLEYITEINGLVLADKYRKANLIRQGSVRITGTDYHPPYPITEEFINNRIDEINNTGDAISAALNAFCFICRDQWYDDGNKRTAQLICNKILIDNGIGIFMIPTDTYKRRKFIDKLIDYYDFDEIDRFKAYLKRYIVLTQEA
ncbi:MAG: Fic family protein [Coriobacteriales bacterium]|jgi:Fic family protein|nr:Fic family protein [Coriobacteriales bacterium]